MNTIITSIAQAGADVRVFELKSADGTPLPAYAPGAHLDLTLGNGLVRQYSLCCRDPSPERYRIAVKRDPASRGGSAWLHEHAEVGTMLEIGLPRNAFGLGQSNDPHLLLAGGIGITPLLSMAYALLRAGREFHLASFARDQAALPLPDDLASIALHAPVSIHVGLDPHQTRSSLAQLMAGYPRAEVYTCGPAPFMDLVTELGATRFGAQSLHQESFQAPLPASGDRPFRIRLKNGRELDVPVGTSALACLQEAGIDAPCSCEVGVCGTCRVAIVSGQARHHDSFLSDEEKASGKWFLPCVSRATTEVLALDL